MRISIVTETYFPQLNGVSRTLGQLVRVLEAAGDQVQLIHPDYGRPRPAPPSITVASVQPPFYPELYLPLPPFAPALNALDDFAPNIVHIATEATLGLRILKHTLARRYRVVSSFHTNFDQYTAHYRIGCLSGGIWRYLRWFHNRTLETYVPSRVTKRSLEARGFERLQLWPRGVDGTLFRPNPEARSAIRAGLGFRPEHVVVGHVSRIAAEKNVAFLGAALEELERARPDAVRVLVVGDGPARPALERALGPHARFVGYKSGRELADHYAACDLFAFASKTETFGNVILEAMASGLPVVAVRAGGPGETIQPGRTGELVEPDATPAAMTEALRRLVDDAALRENMAAQARDYALSQSWDAIMNALRARYLRLAGSPTGSAVPRPPLCAGAGTG